MMKYSIVSIIVLLLSITANSQPNMVLLIGDDCSYWDIGCYGSKDSKTPNIDRLADEGMLFENSFQAAPMCSPTRHNLYTGIYPVKSGAYPNHTFVKPGIKSIVQYLKPLGYRVALAGKRHIAPKEVFDFEYLGDSKNPDFNLVDEFIADAKSKNQPFCLFLCSYEPHTPWDKGNPDDYNPEKVSLPPSWVDTKETRREFCKYLAEVNYLDGQVGDALDVLKKNDVEDNTLFIFTSEQGNSFPFSKWTCYNTGIHNAFIARWPGKVKKGSKSKALVDYTDVVPTFIDLAGGKLPKELDGSSIKNVLLGKSKKNKEYSFALHTTRGIKNGSDHFGIRSVTDGTYLYITNLSPEAEFNNNITADKFDWWVSWKKEAINNSFAKERVEAYLKRPGLELYNIDSDPYCMVNIIEKPELKERIAKMDKALQDWMVYCGDKGSETEMEAYNHQPKSRRK